MKISKQDWNLVPIEPDIDFDEEHNKKVIAETIRKNKLLAERKKREGDEKLKERSTALAQYLSDLNKGNTNSSATAYFGKQEVARLRGDEILSEIKSRIGNVTRQKIKAQAKIHTA